MMTAIAGWVLIVLATGQPVGTFRSNEECIVASYQVAFSTGQEVRCEPRYRAVLR